MSPRRAWPLLVLCGVIAAGPASAADLAYKYRTKNVGSLQAYNNRPYWKMLSECAGIYGALVNRYEAQGRTAEAETAKGQGVAFARLATSRLQADRGMSSSDALALIGEDVEAGRASGSALFAEPPPRGVSHEQVLDLFCTQIDEAHTSAARFRR